MGIVEIDGDQKMIFIMAHIYFYGNAADESLSRIVVDDISQQWNEPSASMQVRDEWFPIQFKIEGFYVPNLSPDEVMSNDNPINNYFRVEDFAKGNISYVDAINSNTGYFLKANLLNHSTTAAHEFGHSLGLEHPQDLDIRGKGTPGIMYPRGTIVDSEFQYEPSVPPGRKGGTLNPFKRKVLLDDVRNLGLHKLHYKNGQAVIGAFSSVWHEAEER